MTNFSRYQNIKILEKDDTCAEGDYAMSDESITLRFKGGFLNDGIDEQDNLLPAIETEGATHIEHWKNGVLHCESGPAVIDTIEDYKEWWLMGKQIQRSYNK